MSTAFKLLDLTLIQRAGLVARCRLQMPSGLILTCNICRGRKDPENLSVWPVAERQRAGDYADIVSFSNDEMKQAWQKLALSALQPRWQELTQPPKTGEVGDVLF